MVIGNLQIEPANSSSPMRNIPTDLLRAFVAVIDLKGYTRAGERLGRAQPTISLQIKRLQELVGTPLFDKENGGARLTEAGEIAAGYARRILALNDELVMKLARKDARGKLRIGLPNDYADQFLPKVMSGFGSEPASMAFDVTCDLSVNLLQEYREGLLDIVVAMTTDGAAEGAILSWRERLSWVSGDAAGGALRDPVRVVCYQEGCVYRRTILAALQRDGRPFDIVFTSPSLAGIEAALAASFGVSVLAERTIPARLRRLGPEAGLPLLPDAIVGIYVKPGSRQSEAQKLAARFAEVLAVPIAKAG